MPAVEGSLPAVQSYNFSCPPGSYVSGFRGSAGQWLYAFGVSCSDGATSEVWGSMTMPGASSWQHGSLEGYSSVSILMDTTSINQLVIGSEASFGSEQHGGRTEELQCPAGTLVAGVHGRTAPSGKQGAFIYSMGLICRPGKAITVSGQHCKLQL